MDFVNLLLLISASQGFIFGLVILFSPFFKNNSNRYLAYSILILSLLMLNIFLANIGFWKAYPLLEFIYDIEWVFLFPVTFFIYILKTIEHPLGNSKQLKWLFVPIIFSVIINVTSNLEHPYGLFTIDIENKEVIKGVIFGIEQLAYYIFNISMLVWSFILIQKVVRSGRDDLSWIRTIWILVFFLTLTWVVLTIIEDIWYANDSKIVTALLSSALSFFISWVAYNGIYKLKLANDQKAILDLLSKQEFTLRNSKEKKSISSINNQKKNKKPSQSFSEENLYFKKLELLLYDEHIYRDADLNRELVAEKLDISTGYLSQIINTITNQNFASYINSFRIREIKSMMTNEEFDKYSLLAIGLEAGFKSKTTFYTAFKKETGLTPNEFKKRIK